MIMKKQAKDLKIGDRIRVAGKIAVIKEFELSDIGKQGSKKCRIVAEMDNTEKVVIIRPDNYPFDTE